MEKKGAILTISIFVLLLICSVIFVSILPTNINFNLFKNPESAGVSSENAGDLNLGVPMSNPDSINDNLPHKVSHSSNSDDDDEEQTYELQRDKIGEELLQDIDEKFQQLPSSTPEVKRLLILTNENTVFDEEQYEKNSFEVVGKIKSVAAIDYNLNQPDELIEISNNLDVKFIMHEPVLYPILADSVQIINSDDVNNLNVNGTYIDGEHQTICLVDTGVDYTHPDLVGFIINGPDYGEDDSDPMDFNGHGTHMAGILHAVAPKAMIASTKVCDDNVTSPGCQGWDIIDGVQWCIDNKDTYNITAISISLSDSKLYTDANCTTFSGGWLEPELLDAYNNNLFTAIASSNEGYTTGISYPACSDYAVSVGATWKNNTIWPGTNRGPNLDLLAPGASINSTFVGGGYMFGTGTSIATPHVAAGVALLKQYYSLVNLSKTIDDIKTRLKNTGLMIGDWPRIDILAALKCTADIDCDDGLYCNGVETCNLTSHMCESGAPISCSGWDLPGIATCTNTPDNNPFTWDFFAGFTSVCNETADACTIGNMELTHTCNMSQCGAECETDLDCMCETDRCIDSDIDGLEDDYADYPDQGVCVNCAITECAPNITLDDYRCQILNTTITKGTSLFSLPLFSTGLAFNDLNSTCELENLNICARPIAYYMPTDALTIDNYVCLDENETLYPGQGYFINVKNNCSIQMKGALFTQDKIGYLGTELKKGWNIIGSVSQEETFNTGNCSLYAGVGPIKYVYNVSTCDGVENYNNLYEDCRESYNVSRCGCSVSLLEPGLGYWIRTKNNCSLG